MKSLETHILQSSSALRTSTKKNLIMMSNFIWQCLFKIQADGINGNITLLIETYKNLFSGKMLPILVGWHTQWLKVDDFIHQ